MWASLFLSNRSARIVIGFGDKTQRDTEEREEEYNAISKHLGVDIHKEIETMCKYIETKRKKFTKNDQNE